MERYNVLIVEPEGESRGKLKQTAMALTLFNKIHSVSSLTEVLERRIPHEHIDIVVLSYHFSQDDIWKFIEQAKAAPWGEDWAYVLVLKSSEQKSENIASSMIGGVDGFLLEPYSADSLREMAQIAATVKDKNERRRKKMALKVLLKEISGHLDALAFLHAYGKDGGRAERQMKQCCENLTKLCHEDMELYTESLLEVFEDLPLLVNTSYRGVSKRVRDKFEEHMMREIEERYR
jgi:CheY-like chemotaxis protein